jgi:hypothetical protein
LPLAFDGQEVEEEEEVRRQEIVVLHEITV